jgi:hypothetical protein
MSASLQKGAVWHVIGGMRDRHAYYDEKKRAFRRTAKVIGHPDGPNPQHEVQHMSLAYTIRAEQARRFLPTGFSFEKGKFDRVEKGAPSRSQLKA